MQRTCGEEVPGIKAAETALISVSHESFLCEEDENCSSKLCQSLLDWGQSL